MSFFSCHWFLYICRLQVSEVNKHERKAEVKSKELSPIAENVNHGHDKARVFNYRELATATRNFHPDMFLGEGGFGSVYKGMHLGIDEVLYFQ